MIGEKYILNQVTDLLLVKKEKSEENENEEESNEHEKEKDGMDDNERKVENVLKKIDERDISKWIIKEELQVRIELTLLIVFSLPKQIVLNFM